MLCRTANDLYWVSRHMERAENTARLIDITTRIAMLPERLDRGKALAAPWRRALDSLGAVDTCLKRYGSIDADTVLDHLLLSADNPSSILSCLRAARESARAQRVAITSEMYEDLNTSWLEIRGLDSASIGHEGLSSILERVKSRSASFRGVTIGTLGRGEGYQFMQLGVFIERAEWAVRLLDVVGSDGDLPECGEARNTIEYFQWSALLQSLSAFETYRRLHRHSVTPAGVAEVMLLHDANPRSLQTCTHQLHQVLQTLAGGRTLEVVRKAGALSAHTRYARIDEILADGLEPWLQNAMERLDRLGNAIHRQFMTAADTTTAQLPPKTTLRPSSQPQFQAQTLA
jgi:uncharacterized alpha-E superfamily protein